jgi:hypothetical protein
VYEDSINKARKQFFEYPEDIQRRLVDEYFSKHQPKVFSYLAENNVKIHYFHFTSKREVSSNNEEEDDEQTEVDNINNNNNSDEDDDDNDDDNEGNPILSTPTDPAIAELYGFKAPSMIPNDSFVFQLYTSNTSL